MHSNMSLKKSPPSLRGRLLPNRAESGQLSSQSSTASSPQSAISNKPSPKILASTEKSRSSTTDSEPPLHYLAELSSVPISFSVPEASPSPAGKPSSSMQKILDFVGSLKNSRCDSYNGIQITVGLQQKELKEDLEYYLRKQAIRYSVSQKEVGIFNITIGLNSTTHSGSMAEIQLQLGAQIITYHMRYTPEVISGGLITDVEIKDFIKSCKPRADREVIMEWNENGKRKHSREPDAQWNFRGARWPGVVMEFSYSQQKKDLECLAWDYIVNTDGAINLVIGIDVDYKTKVGTITMWRPMERRRGSEIEVIPKVVLDNKPTGKTVLIWGGSGSVGVNVIQLAVAAGYEVIATASPANFDYLKELGASEVLDYHSKTDHRQ
ncbi:hypothetical protein B7494_g2244 [Chlorociboria aeruginascens]|nr:hypothetical protein B7494_g2244 [Chlorociboria aeruginascens]